MTYRSQDPDAGFNTQNQTHVSAPVRHLRSRRRNAALRHRTSGASITGFGI